MIDLAFIPEDATDYWYDEGYDLSRRLMQGFTPAQWDELLAAWPSQSGEWQERLAYILADDLAPREVELLVDMYRLACRDIQLSAADMLRRIDVVPVRSATARRLGDRAESIDDIERCQTVNALLDLIASARSA